MEWRSPGPALLPSPSLGKRQKAHAIPLISRQGTIAWRDSREIGGEVNDKHKKTAEAFAWQFLEVSTGAGNEIRTRDPNLGKVVLYH